MDVGPLIAAGRDCDIYAAGAGKVVRRARDGRSLEREASVMRHARRHGYPTPEVFDAAGPDILMERLYGVNMLQDTARRPWRAKANARVLVKLLDQLATVPAPGWLPVARGCLGPGLLHLDLHPLNVLLCDGGPRVVDWANARRGAPAAELTNTWITMATVPVGGPLHQAARRLLLGAYLDGIDLPAARRYLAPIAARRRADRHALAAELAGIDRLVGREAAAEPT